MQAEDYQKFQMADWIFLNNHVFTKPSKEWTEQMVADLQEHWMLGPTHVAKLAIAELSGFPHFTLTSGHSEGNFHVLLCHYIDSIRETGRTHILSSQTEGPSILEGIKRLEKFEVQGKILPVNEQGQLTKSALEEAMRARSSLLSISWAHPLTGVIQPLADLYEVCREHDVALHVDISSALSKLSLVGLDADYVTFDGRVLHCPTPLGGIFSKKPLTPLKFGEQEAPYASYATIARALEWAEDQLDHYAMEIGRLRDLLETKVATLGGKIFFQEVERLSNCTVFAFKGIHSDKLLDALKKEGIFATNGDGHLARVLQSCEGPFDYCHCAISMALSDETTEEEIERVGLILEQVLIRLTDKKIAFSKEEAKAKGMRVCEGTVGEEALGRQLTLSILIDEEDGVIADCTFKAFGPPSLETTAEATCALLLRKNYMQAKRLSADLIEKKIGTQTSDHVNFVIDAIEVATEKCLDIPIEDVYVAPPEMVSGERQTYSGWESLSNDQKKMVIDEVMQRDIQPYVELDAGGVKVVKVEENRVTIAYSGNCTSCFSATGATLDAIGNILRHNVYPDLMVVPDMSALNF